MPWLSIFVPEDYSEIAVTLITAACSMDEGVTYDGKDVNLFTAWIANNNGRRHWWIILRPVAESPSFIHLDVCSGQFKNKTLSMEVTTQDQNHPYAPSRPCTMKLQSKINVKFMDVAKTWLGRGEKGPPHMGQRALMEGTLVLSEIFGWIFPIQPSPSTSTE